MRIRVLCFLFCFFFATSAHADDAKSIVTETGAGVFFGGYAPAFLAAVPSTAGLFGRAVVHVSTGGLYYIAACARTGTRGPYDEEYAYVHDSYLCNGEHGAIQLLLPLAGPFLFAANHPHDDIIHPSGSELSGTTKALLYASGSLQIAGAITMLVGLAMKSAPAPRPTTGRVSVLPSITPTSIGVSASLVTF